MMRLTFRLAIALLTFLTGIISVGLLTHYPFRSAEKISAAVPIAAELKVKVNPPNEWKKFDVNKQFTPHPERLFSFYLPPDMQEFIIPDQIDFGQPLIHFSGRALSFNYKLIDKSENEALWHGKMTCESWAGNFPDQLMSQSAEVEFGGKRATLTIWQSRKPKLNHITLCFPDIGNGTILQLWAVSENERPLDIVEQIFGTIEFP